MKKGQFCFFSGNQSYYIPVDLLRLFLFFLFLVSRLQPKGLWIHACPSVPASVRPSMGHTISGDPCIKFDDFLHKATP